jgi:gamma-glutamyltranspeptidase
MSKFAMMSRPKKPTQDERLQHALWNDIGMPDVLSAVEEFMKKHTHLKLADVSLEYNGWADDGTNLSLQAAGKPHSQYQKELRQYKKELKVYNNWRADNREEILKHKVAEKERIAKNKLEWTQERLVKELKAVNAKMEKA